MSIGRWLRALLPLVVTGGVFALIFQRVSWSQVAAHLGPESLPLLAPALLVDIGVSLSLDALSLRRTRSRPEAFSRWARLRGATYPVGVLHYALGSAALILLLRRRAGLALADATGTAMLIAGLDLVAVLTMGLVGGAFASEVTGLRVGIVALVLLGAPVGFWLLRTPRPLGPLEAIRSLGILRAARDLPTARLLELFGLRLLFVGAFIALGTAALASFGLHPAPATLVAGLAQVGLVAALPIAVAGLGTSQAAFLYVFRTVAPAEELLACSVALSAGMIVVRVCLGALFVTEYSSPAWSREETRA
jgi:hypothetical protein